MDNCPVCSADLSPLDLVSKNEHITVCLENGPSSVEFEAGQLVIKKHIPIDKQRKICPICSRTFQNIFFHFKSCALRNDLIPDLMQSYWFQLNDECKTSKSFPRDLLESYIAKSTKEGRVGEQVEFARQLLLTLPENRRKKSATGNRAQAQETPSLATSTSNLAPPDDSNQSTLGGSNADSNSMPPLSDSTSNPSVHEVLMQNSARVGPAERVAALRPTSRAKTRLELASKEDKKNNIELRIERELAAPRLHRYRQALIENGSGGGALTTADHEECIVLSQHPATISRTLSSSSSSSPSSSPAVAPSGEDDTLKHDMSTKYFSWRDSVSSTNKRNVLEEMNHGLR